jgi:two-component system chemotaxis response regulator CheB
MPEMNGLEFLQARNDQGIDIPVIILSSVAEKGAKITMDALALGASEFITKPSGSVSHDIHAVGDQLVAMLRGYGGRHRQHRGQEIPHPPPDHALKVPQVHPEEPAATTTARPSSPPVPAQTEPAEPPGIPELIVLGISTGGPNALRKVLSEIDSDIGLPIVVVQHMPPGFTTEFARSLNRVSPLEVKEAAEGDLLKPNRVLIAPGNYHIEVEKRSLAGIVHLNQNDLQNGHRPSAGVLFSSAARHFGKHALAVIMTGMGRDGAYEIGEIYAAGGMTIGQDEASSVVYGMPRVAQEQGYIHRQVSLDDMAATLAEVTAELRQANAGA